MSNTHDIEREAADTLADLSRGETVDVVIAVGDPSVVTVTRLSVDVADALEWEGATVNARISGRSAWEGIPEHSEWFAATLPASRVTALRAALRIVARRHGQDCIALTIGACELVG